MLANNLNALTLNRDTFLCLDVPLPENIFAKTAVCLSDAVLAQQAEIILAIESVVSRPDYQNYVLNYAPNSAHFIPPARGVFFGYDFHVDEQGQSKLIEINTNAGAALLNSIQFELPTVQATFLEMFKTEWQLSRDSQKLNTIAIVDDSPEKQYLHAEFLLFKQLFEKNGIQAFICSPESLRYEGQKLWFQNNQIDLIYNRLTDFSLQEENQKAIVSAYLDNNVVITPHPRAHALYATKRNLTVLSDEVLLKSFGVNSKTCNTLIDGIASTFLVEPQNAEQLWKNRKKLFFKPANGYGSKAAYRGDKLTTRVFDEILTKTYVAQQFVQPQILNVENEPFKCDIRAYVYNSEVQLTCARLYQGQTTNFRTAGGGFAKIVAT